MPEKAMSVFDAFDRTADACPKRPFLNVTKETASIYGIPHGDISYGDMARRVAQRRAAYRDAGYGSGFRVGLLFENRPEFFEHFLALNAEGVSIVPINPDLRHAELEYLISHSELALIIALPERQQGLADAAKASPIAVAVAGSQDPVPVASHRVEPWSGDRVDWEAALLYTSGTTGLPKGCVLSNTYFLRSAMQYLDSGGYCAMNAQGERMISPLPLFHMNALAVSAMTMIMIGGCVTFLDRFHPRSWWDSVRESQATIVHYLGVMPAMLMSLPSTEVERDHAVRFGFGAGVDNLLHDAFEERYGFPLIEAWAMTETGNGNSICAAVEPRHTGTSCFGRPADNIEVRLVDDQDNEVADGEPGELLVRSSDKANPRLGFIDRYLKDEAATVEAWRGGWFHTGDLVSRNPDGTLRFVDRKKNVIRRSGENIAAVEVEVVLNRHEAISSAAVGAVPDPIRGDEVFALIVAEGGSPADPQALAEKIVTWSLGQLAYYKPPGYITFVEDLPLTPTNKIKRGDLKAEVLAAFDAGSFVDVRHLKKRGPAS